MITLKDNDVIGWIMAAKVFRAYDGLRRANLLPAFMELKDPGELANEAGVDLGTLLAVLRLLTKAGFFQVVDNRYKLTSNAQANSALFGIECVLSDAMEKAGGIADGLTGRRYDPLDHIEDDEFFCDYVIAMQANARPLALSIIRNVDIPRNGMILDLGSADGSLLCELLKMRSDLSGRAIDRPVMQQKLYKRAEEERDEISGKALIILSNISHLLPDAILSDLLGTIARYADKNTIVAIYDMFPSPGDEILIQDLLSMDWVSGGIGFFRTSREFSDWMISLGYNKTTIKNVPLLPGDLVIGLVL